LTIVLMALAVVMAACGGLLGWEFFVSEVASEHDIDASKAPWRLLPQPPEGLARLVQAAPYAIYAETTSGQLLGCKRASRYDIHCWFELKAIPELPERPCIQEGGFPQPPSSLDVLQVADYEYCEYWLAGKASVSAFRYVLTVEGEVWQWGFDHADLVPIPNYTRLLSQFRSLACLASATPPAVLILPIWWLPSLRVWRRKASGQA
jgi:hypothetical protein